MTNEELVELYQNGDKQALNELVKKNTGIVYRLVNKFYIGATNSIDREDLEQEGFLGLIAAADKYKLDMENKAQFITYAVYWIYHKINRFINQKNTNEEISLNTPTSEDGDKELMDYVEGVDYSFENVEEKLYLQQLRQELDRVMNEKLPLKEREILKLHYGWDNNKCLTLQEIGEIFGVTRQRVQGIENKAFLKIRYTPWGRLKAMEISAFKRKARRYKFSSIDDDIDFARKYLEVEI